MLPKLRTHAPMVVALMALFFAIGGPSFAADAAKSAAKLITGKNVKDSSLTTKDIRNRSLLAVDFKAGQLPAGPAGPQGPQGPKGDPGTPATKLWARVSSAGVLDAGSGAVSAARAASPGDGYYNVDFNQSVVNCAFVASQVSPPNTGLPYGVTTLRRPGASPNPNRVEVFTNKTVDATPFDTPFNVVVFC